MTENLTAVSWAAPLRPQPSFSRSSTDLFQQQALASAAIGAARHVPLLRSSRGKNAEVQRSLDTRAKTDRLSPEELLLRVRNLAGKDNSKAALVLLHAYGSGSLATNGLIIQHRPSGRNFLFIGHANSGKAAAASYFVTENHDLIEGLIPGEWRLIAHWYVITLFLDNRPDQLFAMQSHLFENDRLSYKTGHLMADRTLPELVRTLVAPTGEPVHIDGIIDFYAMDASQTHVRAAPPKSLRPHDGLFRLLSVGPLRETVLNGSPLLIATADKRPGLIPESEFSGMVSDLVRILTPLLQTKKTRPAIWLEPRTVLPRRREIIAEQFRRMVPVWLGPLLMGALAGWIFSGAELSVSHAKSAAMFFGSLPLLASPSRIPLISLFRAA
jgi:hypothetical protein